MYTVFLAGGIASGKSTVAQLMHELGGAALLDLDEISRTVLAPGSALLQPIAAAFGSDLVSQDGVLDRKLLAERAFANEASTRLLEQIEVPYIIQTMKDQLAALEGTAPLCVVQIPLLDRAEAEFDLADEIVAVIVPRELRRERAIGRGMTGEDFDARDAKQPSEDYLRAHATSIIENAGGYDDLRETVRVWLADRGFATGEPARG